MILEQCSVPSDSYSIPSASEAARLSPKETGLLPSDDDDDDEQEDVDEKVDEEKDALSDNEEDELPRKMAANSCSKPMRSSSPLKAESD